MEPFGKWQAAASKSASNVKVSALAAFDANARMAAFKRDSLAALTDTGALDRHRRSSRGGARWLRVVGSVGRWPRRRHRS